MAVRRKAQTQTEAYWRRDFRVRTEDLECIYDLILDDGRPRTLDELACEVIARHCRREAQAREPQGIVLYRPREHYDVGQQLLFPNLDYKTGQVVARRPGRNPRYGQFSVISVALEGQARPLEFAADLVPAHALNELNEEVLAPEDGELTPEELCREYGAPVRDVLREALRTNLEFVACGDLWFLRGLLPEVHLGHLNLAEAVVDVAGHPLSTEEILRQVELSAESKPQARVFALNVALEKDGRFDNVGSGTHPRWFLYNLEPSAVASKPDLLLPDFGAKGGELLHREALEIAQGIGDELDEVPPAVPAAIPESGKVSFVLNYPHRQSGTFPLTREIVALLPSEEYTRIPVHFRAGRGGSRWMGWVLPAERYGWGLGDWFQKEEIPAGATVELLLTSDPYTFVVQCESRSRRSEWARVPAVENNRLTFEIRRRAYNCRYDRNLLLGEPTSTARLEELRRRYHTEGHSLLEAIRLVFPELAKLSGQGLVDARALYAAINVLWRSGAVPILAELARQACFDPMGDGNWAFDESLIGAVYATPQEMETRPHSRRTDLIRDRVLRYGGPA